MFKKAGRVAAIALMLIFSIVLTGCNSSSDTANGLTTKDLPAGWSAANAGLSYPGAGHRLQLDELLGLLHRGG